MSGRGFANRQAGHDAAVDHWLCTFCGRDVTAGGCGLDTKLSADLFGGAKPRRGDRQECAVEHFPSGIEYQRAAQLLLLQKAKEIRDLRFHPRFTLVVNGIEVCTYTPDARYLDIHRDKHVIEEVKPRVRKGGQTVTAGWRRLDPVAAIKVDLFRALHPELELIVVEMS